MLLVGSFGLLAVFLAAVGVYGVISYSVARRTREIGIRVALGAQRGQIFGMIIRHGIGLAGLGIFIGLIAALGMGRILTGFLYEVSAADPLTYGSVSAFFVAIALGASYFPARRAAAVNPLEALRIE
jgi:putative ABC transport system permease protein